MPYTTFDNISEVRGRRSGLQVTKVYPVKLRQQMFNVFHLGELKLKSKTKDQGP